MTHEERIEEIRKLKEQIKDLQAELKPHTETIKRHMIGFNLDKYLDCTLFTSWRKQVDTKKLKEDHPKIYREVVKEYETFSLRI